jgi:ankyrin repeat protein
VHADKINIAEALLQRGANVNLKNNESKTAIDMGIYRN